MAVGFPTKVSYANGDVFSASDINDTNGTINLLGASVAYTAGKNKLINGDFYWNQRNFTSNTTDDSYNFDRWFQSNSGGTVTVTPQTFTLGTAPVSGYEANNYVRVVTASQTLSSHYSQYRQKIENVRTFAGQTVTLSFWAKASSGTPKIAPMLAQYFGSGGSPSANVNTTGSSVTLSTSWARYTATIAVPSISGKTLGTTNNSYLGVTLWLSAGSDYNSLSNSLGLQNATIDIWGVQLEQGSTATAFQTATGTIQGELAACQRYYQRNTFSSGNSPSTGYGFTQTTAILDVPFVATVPMRVSPTAVDYANITAYTAANGSFTGGTVSINLSSPFFTAVRYTHGSAVFTNQVYGYLYGTSGYIGLSAEL